VLHDCFAPTAASLESRRILRCFGTVHRSTVVVVVTEQVLKAKVDQAALCASLVNIIQFEPTSEAEIKAAADLGITLRSLADIISVVCLFAVAAGVVVSFLSCRSCVLCSCKCVSSLGFGCVVL
jgi:hypothetical protein